MLCLSVSGDAAHVKANPVDSLKMAVTADKENVAITISGGQVSPSIANVRNMDFDGTISLPDGTKAWEYRLTVQFSNKDTIRVEGYVRHVTDPHESDIKRSRKKIPIDQTVKPNPVAAQTSKADQLCWDHRSSHFDCRKQSDLKMNLLAGADPRVITSFSHIFVGKHFTERPYAMGEPHFCTWGGRTFDYHGECDLVFLSAKGMLHIHTAFCDSFRA